MRILLSVFIMVLVALPSAVLAQEFPKAGITPDSGLYGLDRAMERISLSLSKDRASKAEKRLVIASERIAELQVIIQNGKTEYVDELLFESKKEMELAQDEILIEKDAGRNVLDLERLSAASSYNQVLILEGVLDIVPRAGQSGLRNAIQEQSRNNQRALSRIETQTGQPAGLREDLALRRIQGKSKV